MLGMSDMSPGPSGGSPGERWPLPSGFAGAARDSLSGALLLERCFDGPGARWSDALIARARRHMGGSLVAVEMALRLELEALLPPGSGVMEALPDAVCWPAVQRRPALLGAGLARHFRDRAAIGLMVRDEHPEAEAETGAAGQAPFSPAAADTLSMLALAQAAWNDSSPDTAPMRADLPAEAMEQLVWLPMALIAENMGRTGLLPVADLLALVDRAGQVVLSRHDEQNGPLALASLFAHQAHGEMDDERLLWLARHRCILALTAIMADRIGAGHEALVAAIVESPEQTLFRLCRAADFPREVAVRLVLGRRCVSRGVEDSVLVHYADEYEKMAPEDAVLAVAPFRMSAGFREKLSLLRDRGLADEG